MNQFVCRRFHQCEIGKIVTTTQEARDDVMHFKNHQRVARFLPIGRRQTLAPILYRIIFESMPQASRNFDLLLWWGDCHKSWHDWNAQLMRCAFD